MNILKFKIYVLHIALNFYGTEEQNVSQIVAQRRVH